MLTRRELLQALASTAVLGTPRVPSAVCGDRDLVEAAVKKIAARKLHTDRHTPWVIMHAVIAFGQAVRVLEPALGRELPAVHYLLRHARYGGRRIFRVVDGLPALPPRERFFQIQDHVDQYLMAFATAGVPLTEKLIAEGEREFHLVDLLRSSQRSFRPDQELAWTLVAYYHYLPLDARWKTSTGESYDLDQLLRLALERDPRRETEGGVHHLYGVAFAVERIRAAGAEPVALSLRTVQRQASAYLARYVELARRFQQPDGSFSAAVFRGALPAQSPRQLVSVTGHMLEWLCRALSPTDRRAEWIRRAVERVANSILATPLSRLSDGGMYHAAHGLRLWQERTEPA